MDINIKTTLLFRNRVIPVKKNTPLPPVAMTPVTEAERGVGHVLEIHSNRTGRINAKVSIRMGVYGRDQPCHYKNLHLDTTQELG